MKKACVIIPYFGNWPPYLNLFLESCSYNPSLTILFFTDLTPPSNYPSNVKFHFCTLEELRVSLNKVVNLDTALTKPYKLCDIRPAYGLLFREHVDKFDFWGWGDIDLILGNLKDFAFENLLEAYDIISFRKNWLSGSLCFIRNTTELNHLFFSNPDYNKVFSTPDYKGFDEISRCWDQVSVMRFESIKWPVSNFTLTVLDNINRWRCHFQNLAKESIPANSYLCWDRGKLTDHAGKAYTHYHFISEKRKIFFDYPGWTDVPQKFFITEFGFFTESEFRRISWISFRRKISALPKAFINYLLRGRNYLARKIGE